LIIGTAGHVDHGKTTLVKALTGVDTDRLKEEKLRGISIDLGFAYLPVADGIILGFVDVPGHERFVHTMVAGASGIDFALMVVAADDGVMPQTREHLAILDLLGIDRGLIAITKAELASEQRLAQVSSAVRAAASGSFLAQAEVIPLSAVTGRGIPTLLERLSAAARAATVQSADALFRLDIDRVFTLHGIGLVVTGTVVSGSVHTGERVLISPSGLEARVRSLHAQGRPMEVGRVGDRCALNLSGDGVSKDAIHRGDVAMAPELHAPTSRIDARLRLLESESGALDRRRFAVRLHHGAAEVGARVVWLGDERLVPGGSADVQLVLDRPIAAAVPDRFVLRDASAKRTDRRRPIHRSAAPEPTAANSGARAAARRPGDRGPSLLPSRRLLSTPPFAWDLTAFARDRALSKGLIAELVSALRPVLLDAGSCRIAVAAERWQRFCSSLVAALEVFHAEPPRQPRHRSRRAASLARTRALGRRFRCGPQAPGTRGGHPRGWVSPHAVSPRAPLARG
jgi:selenocysteine-specific elongation factor